MTATGKVKMFNEDKGYGFIISDAGGEIFFHVSALPHSAYISLGTAVRFQTGIDKRNGKLRAVKVELL
jgi:cold shock protein